MAEKMGPTIHLKESERELIPLKCFHAVYASAFEKLFEPFSFRVKYPTSLRQHSLNCSFRRSVYLVPESQVSKVTSVFTSNGERFFLSQRAVKRLSSLLRPTSATGCRNATRFRTPPTFDAVSVRSGNGNLKSSIWQPKLTHIGGLRSMSLHWFTTIFVLPLMWVIGELNSLTL